MPTDHIRLRQIVEKLTWPENTYCREHLEEWIWRSKRWAEKIKNADCTNTGKFRLQYVLNHICPCLVHRCKEPPAYLKPGDPEYVKMLEAHLMENSQGEFIAVDKITGETVITQPGVEKSNEAWVLFLQLVAPIIGQE